MNGADLIANILKAEGVEILPSFPHSDIIDAAAKVGIRPIIVRQERHAFHIAEGYARTNAGRKTPCVTVQYGPGSENATGAMSQCYVDNAPVLYMPGGFDRTEQGVPNNFNAARNLQNVSKWAEMVYVPERLPQMMQNAFSMLKNGRPGPVMLEVPTDIFTGEVDAALLGLYKPQRRSSPVADAGEIKELASLLLNAKAPVIVAGQGILYGQATQELVKLAELTQTPVMSTQDGKSAFPENHPLALGCGGNSRPDTVVHFLNKADVIIGLGTSFTRSNYITPFPTKGRVFAQLTNWEGDISKDYPIDMGIVGDAKTSIAALIKDIESRNISPRDDVAPEIASVRKAYMDKWMPLLTSDEEPLNPYRIIWELMQVCDRTKTSVTHDAGSPRDQTTAFYEAIVPHGYMGWGKTTQLGTGLGLAQGAKLAKPDWNCFNIMGDAAIGMVGMDIETAARNKLGVTSIIFKNSLMGGYSDYHPAAAEKFAVHELSGDYADMGRSLGAYGERVSKAVDIVPALKRAMAENAKGTPAVLEFITKEEAQIPRDLPNLD